MYLTTRIRFVSGQTYEMLHLYHYACYYYKKAAYLRPADARMWCAVGSCTLKLVSAKAFVDVCECVCVLTSCMRMPLTAGHECRGGGDP